MADSDQQKSPVSKPLVKILAEMVEYALQRDSDARASTVESAPKATARRNGGSPA